MVIACIVFEVACGTQHITASIEAVVAQQVEHGDEEGRSGHVT